MNPTDIFQNLLDTQSDSQLKQRHEALISEYIHYYGFKLSPDKKMVFGKLTDSEGNIMEIEEPTEIDVIIINLEVFKKGLTSFKTEINKGILVPRDGPSKIEYLKIIKFQLENLEPIFKERLPDSGEGIINEVLTPAIDFVNNYIIQIQNSGVLVLDPPKKLNWNGNMNALSWFIRKSIEPNIPNDEGPLITNHINEIIDFVFENFTWQNSNIKKDTLIRSVKDDKVFDSDKLTRKRKPSV